MAAASLRRDPAFQAAQVRITYSAGGAGGGGGALPSQSGRLARFTGRATGRRWIPDPGVARRGRPRGVAGRRRRQRPGGLRLAPPAGLADPTAWRGRIPRPVGSRTGMSRSEPPGALRPGGFCLCPGRAPPAGSRKPAAPAPAGCRPTARKSRPPRHEPRRRLAPGRRKRDRETARPHRHSSNPVPPVSAARLAAPLRRTAACARRTLRSPCRAGRTAPARRSLRARG